MISIRFHYYYYYYYYWFPIPSIISFSSFLFYYLFLLYKLPKIHELGLVVTNSNFAPYNTILSPVRMYNNAPPQPELHQPYNSYNSASWNRSDAVRTLLKNNVLFYLICIHLFIPTKYSNLSVVSK